MIKKTKTKISVAHEGAPEAPVEHAILKPKLKAASEKEALESDSEGVEVVELTEAQQQQLMLHAAALGENPPMIYSDKFVVISDAFQSKFVKGVELPKMIFKKTREDEQTIQDKSVLMVYLDMTVENVQGGCLSQLYKTAQKGPLKLQIKWLTEEDADSANPEEAEEPLSVWKFEGARIHGIDFGNIVRKRADINMVSVEITYDTVNIDKIAI